MTFATYMEWKQLKVYEESARLSKILHVWVSLKEEERNRIWGKHDWVTEGEAKVEDNESKMKNR